MGKEIKFCLVYRDMWQSSGKYMPRVDQLTRVAPGIIEMGCFSRVETNGGGFEQINLLFGENPNQAVRKWTQPFNDVGIQTQMLERGLNGIRMSPVSKDLRRMMFKLKKLQGTDISRSFDGLNDHRNLKLSVEYAREGGMVSQACLCITFSPIHTVDYYIDLAMSLIDYGAEEICIKDMAGIGRPASIGRIVAGIKAKKPDILIQYHGHSTPGFSIASALEAARGGAEIIDVGMEPLSWGTGHADLLTTHAMLKDAGFSVPDINMDAYMQVRSMTQEFVDDFLGYYINPRNRFMNSLLIGPGLPGGMMGSLMADLENNLASLNKWLAKRNQPELTQDALLLKLFNEVEYIWPMLGNPPLVTPYSQYVKNAALMNVMQMVKGRERWSMLDDNTWDMILGKSGKVPGPIASELQGMATDQGREFFGGDPQDLFPDSLDEFRKEMDENGWEYGEDEEELFELAMHPQQYRAFKSGKAKADFEADLAKRKEAASPAAPVAPATGNTGSSLPAAPQVMNIDVNGEQFRVTVSYGADGTQQITPATETSQQPAQISSNGASGSAQEILAPLEGTFFLTKEASDTPIKLGDTIKTGDVIGYIESMKVINAVSADKAGRVVEICATHNATVEEDDVLVKVE